MTVESIKDIREKIIIPATRASSEYDWAVIDEEIQTLEDLPRQNDVADFILEQLEDSEDPQVRDALASSLCHVNITDREILDKAIELMTKQAVNPEEEVFAAGRAALFLHEKEIKAPLVKFVKNAKNNRWENDLIMNIPELAILF